MLMVRPICGRAAVLRANGACEADVRVHVKVHVKVHVRVHVRVHVIECCVCD